MNNKFFDNLNTNPIIGAINNMEEAERAIHSPCNIVFLLHGDIFNIKHIVDRVKDKRKLIYVHIDLIEGLSKSIMALKFMHEHISPDGIITTKGNLVKAAKQMDFFSIQRLFALDSLSLETGIKSVKSTKPDAIEILPGIIPRVTKYVQKETNIPIIAGGLITHKEDVIHSLQSGAIGISTSNEKIWYV
ncbi:glycerol-3-phosphate responsive antiterminator [Irregularibacter muris]|uniref:Glycerol-3-phosphate responsive antiterminator n=1 Tax=Irregularibacter muris TaxID=1796619 RepID=A0AAE3HEE1_9FIRM|nr:glycerol-3-phosphate responsive antiterminator [Irregularibacter muris]MCR1897694.1 glycerol-3-phosphate responsive antiterminator [Irregularibacter muris]